MAYQGPSGVPADVARGFLEALRSEYVTRKGGGVGDYFDRKHVQQKHQVALEPFEDRVRAAGTRAETTIAALRSEWFLEDADVATVRGSGAVAARGLASAAAAAPATMRVSGPAAASASASTRVNEPAAASVSVSMRVNEPAAASVSASMRVSENKNVSGYREEICRALSLPPGSRADVVARAGMAQNENLEILRKSIGLAHEVGLGDIAEVREAEDALRAAALLPEDWDIQVYASGRYLEGGSGGRQDSTVVAFQLQSPEVMQEVQALFDATYRKVYTRDRRGAPIPDGFRVREVYRVMNGQVWREYSSMRESIRARLQGLKPRVPHGTATGNHLANNAAGCLPTLDGDVNEHWLFHGTSGEGAKGIAENDFRLDLTGSNAGTLYGKGIYLAENASKSDEYGEGPKGPAGETMGAGFEAPRPPGGHPPPVLVRESYMLLCRSTLGNMNYSDERSPNADQLQRSCMQAKTSRPCKHACGRSAFGKFESCCTHCRGIDGPHAADCADKNAKGQRQFDSVLGDRLKINGTFREIVVYSDDQVYPEYVVKYERVFFHERFADIYRAMSRRKKRSQFKGPTEDEKLVLTSMWNVFGMPNRGRINKWQLLDLLNAIKQPPQNEAEDLDETFKEWDTKKDGWIDCDEFLQEMTQRVNDGLLYYEEH